MNKTKAIDVSIHDVLAAFSIFSAKTKQLNNVAEMPVVVGIKMFIKHPLRLRSNG